MSVCGIVILVTLLLVLKLIAQTAADIPDSPPAVSSEELRNIREQMDALEQLRRDIQDEIVELQRIRSQGADAPWTPSETQRSVLQSRLARLEAESRELEGELEAAEKKTEEFEKREDAIIVRNKEELLKELHLLAEQLQETNEQLVRQQDELRRQAQTARDRNAELDRELAASDSQKIFFAKRHTTDKTPYILVYGVNGITVSSFTKTEPTTFGSDRVFLEWARKNCKPRTEYFVLYLRPSRIGQYQNLIDALRSIGFDVGFDLIGEETEFSLQSDKET